MATVYTNGDSNNNYLSQAGKNYTWEVHGRAGNDTLLGGNYNDLMYGDEGFDFLNGGSGNDQMHGGTGNDTLVGGYGYDTIYGGEGSDNIIGSDDNLTDFLYGGGYGDFISAGKGDRAYGQDGYDILEFKNSQSGWSSLNGGNGNDTFRIYDNGCGGTVSIEDFQRGDVISVYGAASLKFSLSSIQADGLTISLGGGVPSLKSTPSGDHVDFYIA